MEYPFNLDFLQKVAMEAGSLPWEPSPAVGVERIMLEREAPETGRATSLVRYAAGSTFKEHVHTRGEEIFVLEGEFTDESGTYSAGHYLRNPVGSKHTPSSGPGCVLFVKLGHMDPRDQSVVRLDTNKEPWRPGRGALQVMPLHQFQGESTALVKWPPGCKHVPHSHFGGEEIFVLSGIFHDQYGAYPKYTWLRSPHMSNHHPFTIDGCVIFVKVGHLPEVR